MSRIVCKFGGSSLADANQFRKVRAIVEAEAEAAAIYMKLEAEARGQYEIMAKKADAMRQLVKSVAVAGASGYAGGELLRLLLRLGLCARILNSGQ